MSLRSAHPFFTKYNTIINSDQYSTLKPLGDIKRYSRSLKVEKFHTIPYQKHYTLISGGSRIMEGRCDFSKGGAIISKKHVLTCIWGSISSFFIPFCRKKSKLFPQRGVRSPPRTHPPNPPLASIPIDMMNNQTKTLKWSLFYKNNLRVAAGVSVRVAVEKEEQLTLTTHSHRSHAQKVTNCTHI